MNEAHDVTVGLPLGAFASLTPAERTILAKLLSRVAERSYRRGACHAAMHDPDELPRDLVRWRYGIRLDVSPLLNSDRLTRPAIAMLFEHNPRLRRLGILPPVNMEPRL